MNRLTLTTAIVLLAFPLVACSKQGSVSSNLCEKLSPKKAEVLASKGGFDMTAAGTYHWNEVGRLTTNTTSFCLYLYVANWNERQTTRLVFFSGGDEYLGSYSLTAPRKVSVDGDSFVVEGMTGKTERFRVEGNAPPRQVVIDGEVSEFFR